MSVWREFHSYKRMVQANRLDEDISASNFLPFLMDKYDQAGDAGLYFYQDTWCARKLFRARPELHVDVGSSMMTAGIISQFVDLIYVDVRPLNVNLPGFGFRQGNLTALPFDSGSVESISSLSVVEHVGLARYGDPLDPLGTDKACAELSRVVAPNGTLYVAVPTEKQSSTHFNAHRIFAPDKFVAKFPGLRLAEERYASGDRMVDRAEYERMGMPYAYGCFEFRK